MATLYTRAESNSRRTFFYLFIFSLLIIGVGWLVSYILNNPGILIFAVFLSALGNIASYWYSDKIVLAMSGARAAERSEYTELFRIVENLSITAGLPMPKIFIINSSQPNAFATGRNKEHAVVAVTTGLLERLERVELEGVIAHELSHIGNKDILLQTIIVIMAGVVALIADLFFRMSLFGGRGNNDRRGGHPILFVIAILGIVLAPIAATMIRLAISRRREFLADADGALLTRYPEGLARALEKISSDPAPMRQANDATSHLFIASPFRGREKSSWIHKLFMTHPPIADRLAALREMDISE